MITTLEPLPQGATRCAACRRVARRTCGACARPHPVTSTSAEGVVCGRPADPVTLAPGRACNECLLRVGEVLATGLRAVFRRKQVPKD